MNRLTRRSFVKSASLASVASCATVAGAASKMAAAAPDSGQAYHWASNGVPDRYWTGPDTWANPWEDWRVEKDWLVCTSDAPVPRTVHCLTHQLGESAAEAKIGVMVRYRGEKASGKKTADVAERSDDEAEPIDECGEKPMPGSAGFELGIRVKDPIDDYRSRLLFGAGMPAGLNGRGELFIGRRARETFPALADALAAGEPVQLSCKISRDEASEQLRVELRAVTKAWSSSQPSEVFRVVRHGVPAEDLAGNVALVNNFRPQVAGTESRGLFAFRDWTIAGPKVLAKAEQAFGPVLWTLYTLSDGVMKLTAQMPPLGDGDSKEVRLQIQRGEAWRTISTAEIDPLACTATFRVANWDDSRDTFYRVCWTQTYRDGTSREHAYEGTIRRDPKEKPELVVAGYCCFTDYLFPNSNLVEQTRRVDPDVMFFLGDQIYEHVGGFNIVREGDLKRMTVNYLRKLALLGWSFRDLSKDRPTVWIPDDHDVYQGNLWGSGGRKITLEEWNRPSGYGNSRCWGAMGGYVQPAEFVKAVERTQTAHLPDPYDPRPVEQDIGVYFTSMKYGGVSFAILEDRKFKSGPLAVLRHRSSRPDWFIDSAAALAADVPGAELLGERQLAFLRDWIADWRDVQMKMAVSQTIFCNPATHHGRPTAFLQADADSNGWPQSGRNAALDVLRRGGVFMLGGDQHLPTLIQHGIERHRDAGVSFCVPAGAVGYQRWWMPEECEDMPRDGECHDDRPNTGKYRDGFGNLIDVVAVANPATKRAPRDRLELGRAKSSGYGVVRMNKLEGTFTVEAWPVDADPTRLDEAESQYPGWPITVGVDDCAGPDTPKLPVVELNGQSDRPLPLVRVLDADGQIVTAARAIGERYVPRVFDRDGLYVVEVVVPESGNRVLKRFENVRVGQTEPMVVDLGR